MCSVEFIDAYHKSSKLLLRFGLVAGVFPVSRNSEGTYKFRWISVSTFYSVFVYVLTSCAVTYSTYVKVLNFSNPDLPFDEYLFTLIFIVTLSPHWLFQIFCLGSGHGLAEYLTMWTRFQKHFRLVTGSSINLDYRIKFIVILSLGTILAVVLPIVETAMLDSFTLYESVGFFHVLILDTFLCVWWSQQCSAFVCAARSLRKNLKKEITESPRRLEIRRYRYLWEHNCALIDKLSSSMGRVFGVYNFSVYLMLFGSVYCTVTQIFGHRRTNRSPNMVGFFICTIYYGTFTYAFCNSAHFLEDEITRALVYDLMGLRLHRLSYANAREVHAFLNAINAKKVGLVVSGNFKIGRGTLTAYASSMAMYCLVLLQFKITLPGEY